VVAIYGVVGVDGTGEAWEYLDAVCQRNNNTASPVWSAGDWTITSGAGAATPGTR